MKNSRPNLLQPTYGSITQGTVFSCAQASRYEACEVFGLTITARCDVAQQKYPVLNYIPLVKLTDWFRRDGLDMLMELERRNLGGKLKGLLKQSQLSESLTLAVTLDQIAEKHFPLGEGSKAQKNASRKFHDLVAETLAFEKIGGFDADQAYAWFAENRVKEIENIVRRLSRNDVLGHYFLEKIAEDNDTAKGYVCLLREVVTLPRNIAEKVGKGLDRNTYHNLCAGDIVSSGLTIGQNDLSMPIIEIGSPTIEHILQSFTQLFGRIGVADPADEVIGGIVNHCISAEKGSEE